MGSAGRSPYFSNSRDEEEDRNKTLTSALLGSPIQAEEVVDPREQIEDKEIDRLEQQLNYYKKRSEQRKKQKKIGQESGMKETLKGVSDYRRFDLK